MLRKILWMGLLSVAAWQDLKCRKISNRLLLAGVLSGFLMACMEGEVKAACIRMLAAGGIGIGLFVFEKAGAGDVKLWMMMGLWLNTGGYLTVLWEGGLVAFAIMLLLGKWREPIPLAPVMLAGTMIHLLTGDLL